MENFWIWIDNLPAIADYILIAVIIVVSILYGTYLKT